MKAIAIDMGGSHAALAVVEDKRILAKREIRADSAAGLRPLLPSIQKIARELLEKLELPAGDCAGVAVCIAAMVQRNRVVSTNGKFEDAPEIDLVAWFRDSFGLRLALENDARMALVGEWYAGAAEGADDVVMMTLGTGIGAAAMAGGKMFRTSQVQGGCLGGHIPAVFNGRRCTCGAYGCMEAEAAGWSLPLIAKEWPGFAESRLAAADSINFRALFKFASEGDPVSLAIRDRCLRVWASGTVGLIHAYGPQRVVIGGGVMRSAGVILPYIQDYVRKYSWTPSGTVEIVEAALGNDAALLGAVPLLSGTVL
jgi:glucokinase